MKSIKELKQQYQGEWLAIKVTRRDEFLPVEGEVVFHMNDRDELFRAIKAAKVEHIYITYGGPFIKEGYAVAFITF